jgi:MFS transporter, DHA1 family, multidrug resistance protein
MSRMIIYILAFLIKGWEVVILLLLPFFQTQNLINIFQVGILGAIFSASQILSPLLSGHYSEKIGNKTVILISVFFYILAWLTLFFPVSFFSLILICILGGVAGGLFMPLANSAVAKLSDKNRAKELGDFSAFTDLGRVILIPLSTFIIASFSFSSLSLLYTFSSIILFILLALRWKTTNSTSLNTNVPSVKNRELLKNKGYILTILIGISDAFASASLFIFIPLLLLPKGISIEVTGLLSSLFFVGYLFGRVILGRLADKYGGAKILLISEVFMALLTLILIFVNDFILVALILFSLGIFTRGTSPITRSLVADSVSDPHKFDKAYGLYSFSVHTSNVTSRTIYGFLAGFLGISSVFYLSATIALLTVIPIFKYSKR